MNKQYKFLFIIFSILLSVALAGCINNNPNSPTDSNRTISFSGYTWTVKSSTTPVGPGPNYFSDSSENVWIDESRQLHLRITNDKRNWTCAEIVSKDSFGYGTYVFSLATSPDQLDNNAVLGLFTWDDAPDYAHREIDIEFSRWGQMGNDNAQYVVQPWGITGNIYRFNVPGREGGSLHAFNWKRENITFRSYYGNNILTTRQGDSIESWNYSGDNIPLPDHENERINLWLIDGNAPSDNMEIEFVVSRFQFIPG